jgi:hypothetical protein
MSTGSKNTLSSTAERCCRAGSGQNNRAVALDTCYALATMSASNGDKSRHHRLRKRKLQVRQAMRELRQKLTDAKAAPAAK